MIEGWVAVLGLMLIGAVLFGLMSLAGLIIMMRPRGVKSRH